MDQFYMNPNTGEVKAADEWRQSDHNPKTIPAFARWAAENLIEVREPLTDYEYSKYGTWVPVGSEELLS